MREILLHSVTFHDHRIESRINLLRNWTDQKAWSSLIETIMDIDSMRWDSLDKIEDTHPLYEEWIQERRRGGGKVENSRYVIVFPIFLEKFIWLRGREGCMKRVLLRSPRQRCAAIYSRKQRAYLTREHSSWMHKHVCVYP